MDFSNADTFPEFDLEDDVAMVPFDPSEMMTFDNVFASARTSLTDTNHNWAPGSAAALERYITVVPGPGHESTARASSSSMPVTALNSIQNTTSPPPPSDLVLDQLPPGATQHQITVLSLDTLRNQECFDTRNVVLFPLPHNLVPITCIDIPNGSKYNVICPNLTLEELKHHLTSPFHDLGLAMEVPDDPSRDIVIYCDAMQALQVSDGRSHTRALYRTYGVLPLRLGMVVFRIDKTKNLLDRLDTRMKRFIRKGGISRT